MVKKLLRTIYKKYLISKFKKKAIINKCVNFNRTSSITISDGSTRNDIIIGNNVVMHARLLSQNGGKIIFENNTQIGYSSFVGAIDSIIIGEGSVISNNVTIVDNNNHPVNPYDRIIMQKSPISSDYRKWKYSESNSIIIGKNVWVGQYARICKGVIIGDNSIVAANAVVTKRVPPNSIVAGNPGKIVKTDIDKLPRVFKEEL